MYKYVLSLLLFCTSLSALASDPNEHWLEVKTPHFVVLTDSNERQARRIAGQFEQMRSVFHTIVPNATADSGSPIVVLALRDKKGFQALEPEAYLGSGKLNLAGLFLRTPDRNYILLRLDAEGEHPFATVYHEYTHLMLSKATWMPLWLNEGLAEFYQNTDILGKDVILGQPSPYDITFLRENRLLPITTLLAVDHTSPYYHEEKKGSAFYAQSWALTHFIEVTDRQKNTTRLRDYAQLLSKGEDSVTAAQHAFGDLNKLQSDLENYVRQAAFMMFKMNVPSTIDVAAFPVRSVPTPEADAVRANFLVNNQRTKDAQALLETSLRDDPNNAFAHETMGYLKFREGDIPTARKWYGEAVQLDSQSYLAHYYYAVMSMRAGDREQDASIESSLRTAIKLNPTFAPSYDALAMFLATHDQKLDEAHLLDLQAIQIEPDNLNYRLNAASVLSQQRKYFNAIGVLKRAVSVAKTPDQIELVQNRIKQLEQFQAALERAQAQNAAAAQQTPGSHANSQPDATLEATGKTMVFRRVNGKMIGKPEDTPNYPTGDSKGPQHTVKGILRNVQCSYPNVLTLSVDQAGKIVTLYNNNFFKIVFTTVNYEPDGDIKPCTGIEDMKASVKYAEVSDKNVAGQILTIDLSK